MTPVFPSAGTRTDSADTHNTTGGYMPRPIVPSPGEITSPYLPYDMPVERMLAMKKVSIALDTAGDQTFAISGNVLWIPFSTNFSRPHSHQRCSGETTSCARAGWFLAGCKSIRCS